MRPRSWRHEDGTWFLAYDRPARPWSTNQQVSKHWRTTHPIKVAWRDTAQHVAVSTGLSGLEGRWEVTMRVPFDRNAARRDPHNYVGTLVKWTIDGLVKGGVWPDDTPEFVRVMEPELVVDAAAPVMIRLWPMP